VKEQKMKQNNNGKQFKLELTIKLSANNYSNKSKKIRWIITAIIILMKFGFFIIKFITSA